MSDLLRRIEKHLQLMEANGTGNRIVATLLHEALQEVKALRAENHFLKTGGTIPGAITRDAMVEDER
jgi:hypothetical protein